MKYKIVRTYKDDIPSKVIGTDLTLEEAQKYCRDPETSSKTCTGLGGLLHTKVYGEWFDGYDEM